MEDSITLFGEICNSRWFAESHMILFLNKKDIFENKLLRYPLSHCFQDYNGPNTYSECVTFVRQQYESKKT